MSWNTIARLRPLLTTYTLRVVLYYIAGDFQIFRAWRARQQLCWLSITRNVRVIKPDFTCYTSSSTEAGRLLRVICLTEASQDSGFPSTYMSMEVRNFRMFNVIKTRTLYVQEFPFSCSYIWDRGYQPL